MKMQGKTKVSIEDKQKFAFTLVMLLKSTTLIIIF